jgi:hypothetical protein
MDIISDSMMDIAERSKSTFYIQLRGSQYFMTKLAKRISYQDQNSQQSAETFCGPVWSFFKEKEYLIV